MKTQNKLSVPNITYRFDQPDSGYQPQATVRQFFYRLNLLLVAFFREFHYNILVRHHPICNMYHVNDYVCFPDGLNRQIQIGLQSKSNMTEQIQQPYKSKVTFNLNIPLHTNCLAVIAIKLLLSSQIKQSLSWAYVSFSHLLLWQLTSVSICVLTMTDIQKQL